MASTEANVFFQKFGTLVSFRNKIKTHQTLIGTELDDARTEYASHNEEDQLESLLARREELIVDSNPLLLAIQAAAETLLIEDMNDSASGPLSKKDVATALVALNNLMRDDTQTIEETTVSGAVTYGSNTGDGVAVVALTDPVTGEDWHNVRDETIVLECVQDARGNSTLTAGSERFTVRGAESVEAFDRNWPAGSGAYQDAYSSSGDSDQGEDEGETVLRNGDFEEGSANDPTYWTIGVGSAGTDWLLNTSNEQRGSQCLEIVGDGSTNPRIYQSLLSASGSLSGLDPLSTYVLSFWVRTGSSAPAAGVLKLSLASVGGSTKYSASVSVTASAENSIYSNHNVVFRTPANVDVEDIVVAIETTTAIDSGASLLIDNVVCTKLYQFGKTSTLADVAGGPYVAILAGGTDWAPGDLINVAITNNNEGQFVRAVDEFFGAYEKGVRLPTSATPNNADTLIA